jgi:hypothetical protein
MYVSILVSSPVVNIVTQYVDAKKRKYNEIKFDKEHESLLRYPTNFIPIKFFANL